MDQDEDGGMNYSATLVVNELGGMPEVTVVREHYDFETREEQQAYTMQVATWLSLRPVPGIDINALIQPVEGALLALEVELMRVIGKLTGPDNVTLGNSVSRQFTRPGAGPYDWSRHG
jgi:hypothetical protein